MLPKGWVDGRTRLLQGCAGPVLNRCHALLRKPYHEVFGTFDALLLLLIACDTHQETSQFHSSVTQVCDLFILHLFVVGDIWPTERLLFPLVEVIISATINMAPHSELDNDMNGSGYFNGANGNGSVPTVPKNTLQTRQSNLKASDADSVHDLVCCGFGPASLAIAVAIHDSLENGTLNQTPSVLFLEKQPKFAWHAGMLLPGAKMQISFLKDMASLRDPRSHFTFLNYVHKNGRLLDFINLDTFLPARTEYEDYLRWCASHFDDVVRYNSEVVSISPEENVNGVKTFLVVEKNGKTGTISTHRARNVVLSLGGQASIPKSLPEKSPRVIHSSQYAYMLPKLLSDRTAPVRVAVIGAGQSAAEIFNNVSNLYPNSKTYMVMKQEFLKPSDDSPL